MHSRGLKKVYVTHCIDVEGPMTEPLEATWERIYLEDGISVSFEATRENLKKLQDCQLDIGVDDETKAYLARKYSRENLAYLTTWEDLDKAMEKVNSKEFRESHSDMHGNPYRLNWFLYDHYGFDTNPRFHDDGIHHVFDHYHKLLLNENPFNDGIYWHYHHPPASKDALEWSTNWFLNGVHEEIIARRVIERNWFPSVFRAGGHIERNDINFWMEMFIPFDYSSRTPKWLERPRGRASVNDWRYAPTTWGYYHPDWYDYRRPGTMKRALFRCLDLKTWITQITEDDVRDAFDQARSGFDTVLAYYNHDYRDMSGEIGYGHELLTKVAKEYDDVEWVYDDCLHAAREVTGYHDDSDQAPEFHYEVKDNLLTVWSAHDLFGPEPFLAIQENNRFFRDNFTREGNREWCYYFRKPEDVQAFGIAANSPGGKTSVMVYKGKLNKNMKG
jgi:hypothetical protein